MAGSAIDADVWLAACRRMVEAQRGIFADVDGIRARTEYEGIGEGGDHTLVIDRRCEDIVFAELEQLHREGQEFLAVSEERGHVEFGTSPTTWVVIDPIDGSLNARRMIPAHCLSVAVASGPSMADVEFGFVHDFGADEEFTASRGAGARVGGEDHVPERAADKLEVVAIESASPERVAPIAEALKGRAWRVRSPGSIAISLAYIAAGRFDAMLSGRHCRSVDAAAAQVIVRESGGEVAFGDLSLTDAALDLDARYAVAGAMDADGLATMLEIQRSTGSL